MSNSNTLNCQGKLLDLSTPRVMGIINVTPDSFYSGSRAEGNQDAVKTATEMLSQGADMIDIGGQSTRPGAEEISVQEEIDRVIPVIQAIVKSHPQAIVSIDTFNSKTAKASVAAGASVVNDISGGQFDADMFDVVAELRAPYILTHTLGRSDEMQNNPAYDDVIKTVAFYLSERVNSLREKGVNDIVLDPGFGFGKTVAHNYDLLNNLDTLKIRNLPILAGISRKSMIFKPLNTSAINSLNATISLNTIALQNGAKILRVHDISPAVEAVKLYSFVNDPESL